MTADQPQNRFFSQLQQLQQERGSQLCIGLDPDPARFPAHLPKDSSGILAFNQAIVDATHDLVCCYKPQFAYFASEGAEGALEDTISYIKSKGLPVLLDAKRGDIGSTAARYAKELFERYAADAVTVNPYLGLDSLQPYLDYSDRGVFILCRTSNPGGADLQHLLVTRRGPSRWLPWLGAGRPLYERVAELAATTWNAAGNVGLVVGATQPAELRRIRKICPRMTLLVPGVGAQGADVQAMVDAGQGGGLLVPSSRAILYAGAGEDFADQARRVALATRDQIQRYNG